MLKSFSDVQDVFSGGWDRRRRWNVRQSVTVALLPTHGLRLTRVGLKVGLSIVSLPILLSLSIDLLDLENATGPTAIRAGL